MKNLKITGYFAFFVNGMLAVMTGTIISYLVKDYGISYSTVGKLVSAQSIGNLIMVLLSGFVIQFIGRKNTLLLFPILFAVGFGGIAVVHAVPILFVLFILTGLGWGLCNNILNIIMMEDPKNGGISFLYTCYAIGSFMGPFLVLTVTSLGWTWKIAVYIVAAAALLLIPGFLSSKNITSGKTDEQKEKIQASDFLFLKKARYYICLILYFGYIGVEVSINSWIIIYLVETGLMEKKTAQTIFSLYWLLIIIVRILNGAYLNKIRREYLLTAQWIGLAIGLTGLTLVNGQNSAIIIMMIMAIFMAAISPVNAENANEFIMGKGISGGLMFAVGCLGSTILPMLVGNITDYSGIQNGIKIILVTVYMMIVVCFVNIYFKKRSEFSEITQNDSQKAPII